MIIIIIVVIISFNILFNYMQHKGAFCTFLECRISIDVRGGAGGFFNWRYSRKKQAIFGQSHLILSGWYTVVMEDSFWTR